MKEVSEDFLSSLCLFKSVVKILKPLLQKQTFETGPFGIQANLDELN